MAASDITVLTLTANPGIGKIALQWTWSDPRNNALPNIGLAAVEVWASATNDRATASKVSEGRDAADHTGLLEGSTYYYWARARDGTGGYGAFFPVSTTAGVQATVSFASDYTLIGGGVSAAVAANALTVSITLPNGQTPSATNPVRVPFYGSDGTVTVVQITGALSQVISSGSTMGTIASDAFSLWLVGIKSGSSVVLGLTQCIRSLTESLLVYPLNDRVLGFSSTAEGGAGAADGAGGIYTASVISSGAPMRVLARLIWESGLGTPGTWNAVPTSIELCGKDTKLPGAELQRMTYLWHAVVTYVFGGGGTTILPVDDTVPTAAEGQVFVSLTCVPRTKANYFEMEFDADLSPPAANEYVALMIAPSSSAGAEALSRKRSEGADIAIPVRLHHIRKATSTSVVDNQFEFRFGYTAAGTLTVNGTGGVRKFGETLRTMACLVERVG